MTGAFPRNSSSHVHKGAVLENSEVEWSLDMSARRKSPSSQQSGLLRSLPSALHPTLFTQLRVSQVLRSSPNLHSRKLRMGPVLCGRVSYVGRRRGAARYT